MEIHMCQMKDIKTLEDEMELLKSPGSESISEVDTNKIKGTVLILL